MILLHVILYEISSPPPLSFRKYSTQKNITKLHFQSIYPFLYHTSKSEYNAGHRRLNTIKFPWRNILHKLIYKVVVYEKSYYSEDE